jgi:hypothetical protein
MSGQLKALLKKNFILMKRNKCATCCEVFFTIILMIFIVMIRKAVKPEEVTLDPGQNELFFKNYSLSITEDYKNQWNGMNGINPL